MGECGRADFPWIVGVVAGQAGRPIPALPPQSLCSSPQRKCEVWPQDGAHRSQDKEIFRLSPLLPLLPFATHHDDRCAFPVQQNATKCIGRGCHTAARLDKCLSFSQRGSAKPSSWWECGKIQLSQVSLVHKEGLLLTLAGRRTDRNTSDDTH